MTSLEAINHQITRSIETTPQNTLSCLKLAALPFNETVAVEEKEEEEEKDEEEEKEGEEEKEEEEEEKEEKEDEEEVVNAAEAEK